MPRLITHPGSPTVTVTDDGQILPTEKSAKITRLLVGINGVPRDANMCGDCRSETVGFDDFRDNLSRIEFAISRLCQRCQDGIFGDDAEVLGVDPGIGDAGGVYEVDRTGQIIRDLTKSQPTA